MAAGFLKKSRLPAGLSLQDGKLRYLELKGSRENLKLETYAELPLASSVVQQESLANFEELRLSLQSLKSQIGGKWRVPVAVGLPSRDALLRVVDMPAMGLEDARESLRFEFDKYFPFAANDAAYDVAVLDALDTIDPEKMRLEVAACRLRVSELLLEVAKQVGMTVDCIEPLNVAMWRALLGPMGRLLDGYLFLVVGEVTSQIIVGYKDNSILYRTLLAGTRGGESPNLQALAREVASTVSFTVSQFREVQIGELFLTGGLSPEDEANLKETLSGSLKVPVTRVDVWEMWNLEPAPDPRNGWEGALGLAVRGLMS